MILKNQDVLIKIASFFNIIYLQPCISPAGRSFVAPLY
nr:MAG TPA: hypothetical protein [Caudoviricetes sp.]